MSSQIDHEEISRHFNEVHAELEREQEAFWNGLSKADQLKCFCAVVRRLFDGEIKEQRSYRGVLYSIFEFGPESYAQAQMAGFLALHNSIFTVDQEARQLKEFAKHLNVDVTDEQIDKFLIGKIY